MSGSNWVAVVSVIFTSLTAGYATYENNQTSKELEKLKKEQYLSMEEIKSKQAIENLTLNKKYEARARYCDKAHSIYKDLIDAVGSTNDRNLETQRTANNIKSNLTILSFAYLDENIFENFQNRKPDTGSPDDAILAALATQIRACATL
ncbi:hypothetical protein J2Y83_002789 [Pseudomonas marginalis]|uniref:hypothetical protein n=1 Tax=Pseudomonas marginalis TaxID=298 RepID=UPI0020A0240B|nr:hypothetical protein [Pseudomonas marginalis]MCP1506816.1 hypothetical protein [Pseudomonas marginalis]MCP1524320.1 hypothetical protein [Pseudomonas marginalis]MDQ0499733.1 hypothetical protein [Pseudomonas marginalis]